jgi:hypothetical protein
MWPVAYGAWTLRFFEMAESALRTTSTALCRIEPATKRKQQESVLGKL